MTVEHLTPARPALGAAPARARIVTLDPQAFEAVLFDLDGVITDTAALHEAAWAEVFGDLLGDRGGRPGEDHRPLSHQDYRQHLDGVDRRDGLNNLLSARGIVLPEGQPGDDGHQSIQGVLARKQHAFQRRLNAGITANEPATALVSALSAAGLRVGVFSASRNCRAVLAAAGLTAMFDTVVDGIDAERAGLRPKPAADMPLAAAAALGAAPHRCAVLEDSAAGVAAARAGGFATIIGIADDSRGQLLCVRGADIVVPDLTHLTVARGFARVSDLPTARAETLTAVLGQHDPLLIIDAGAVTDRSAVAALGALAHHCRIAVLGEDDAATLRARFELAGVWYAGAGGRELLAPETSAHPSPHTTNGSAAQPRSALRHIADRTGAAGQPVVVIGAGATDEPAFDAVRRTGVGVVVRAADHPDHMTAARYAVDGAAGLVDLLNSWELARRQRSEGPWTLTAEGYRPHDEGMREVLFAAGNGYLGVRACAPESAADGIHYPGTYLAGLFDRVTDHIDGCSVEHESLVKLPNWLPVQIRVEGGPWFDPDTAQLLDYRQTLQLHSAEHLREYRFRDTAGRVTHVLERRFASMHDQHLCALQCTVTPQNWSGRLEFCSLVDAGVTNTGVARYRELDGHHLDRPVFAHLAPDTVLCTTTTTHSRIPIAVAARTTVWDHDAPSAASYLQIDRNLSAGTHISVRVAAERPVSVEKVAALYTGRDPAIGEPAGAATRALAQHHRYRSLFQRHRLAWAHLWEAFGLGIDGAEAPRIETLRALRIHTCHLLQSVSPHSIGTDVGVPARGLHGEGYRGHIFWDELFVLPVLVMRLPHLVRSLLAYRHRRLPEARRAAAAAGYTGAMFPWQSGSDGREESPRTHLNPRSGQWNPDPSARAVHCGLAVAYTIWQYYQATGDLDYLIESGAEDICEIARFWASRCRYDTSRRRYVIDGVIGPDEFHTGYPTDPYGGINNNAYTNVMAVWVLSRAAEAIDALPARARIQLVEKLHLDSREIDEWERITRRMYVPFHDGIITQFDGYTELRELNWDSYRHHYDDIGRLDRILDAEGDTVNAYQVTKQADVLMLFYLLSADELSELLARLGYPFTGDQLPRTIDYYTPRTSHGSTLSAVVHCWVLARGDRENAEAYLGQVLTSDIADRQRGTTAEGVHLAAMAGSLDLLQRCYLGLEARGNRLVVGPMWPQSWGTLHFSVVFRGLRIEVRMAGRTAELTAQAGQGAAITVDCRGTCQQLAPGDTITVG